MVSRMTLNHAFEVRILAWEHMKTIAVCASTAFYPQLPAIKQTLEQRGFAVRLPDSAEFLARGEVPQTDGMTKADFIRSHFAIIHQSDAIVVVNLEKHGQSGYIGPNVLMEMALAFDLNLPIFLLEPPNPESPLIEEIEAMSPIILNRNFEQIRARVQ